MHILQAVIVFFHGHLAVCFGMIINLHAYRLAYLCWVGVLFLVSNELSCS